MQKLLLLDAAVLAIPCIELSSAIAAAKPEQNYFGLDRSVGQISASKIDSMQPSAQPAPLEQSTVNAASSSSTQPVAKADRDTSFHIEGFYRFRLNDNIAVTPGLIWLTAPNHDDRNSDIWRC